MNNYIKLVFVFGITVMNASFADTIAPPKPLTTQKLPQLQQERQHAIISERVVSCFTRSHYRQFDLDENFSSKIFDRYLNLLDYSHNVFLQSDIDKFASERSKVGQQLESGHLNELYAIFNLAQQRRYERFQYALSRLSMPQDFANNDTIEVDRSKAPWPKTVDELNKLWDAKVKFDWLNLKLSGKNDKEIKSILAKRYNFALKRLAQTQSEDVFQLIMNAFAREIDPHTNYLSPRNTEQFNSEMSLSLEGIGAVLRQDEDYVIINSMVVGGPAAKSKLLKVGDKIVGVGQPGKAMTDVVGWRLDDVVALIKGPKGSKVRLEVVSDSKHSKPHIMTLIREHIRLEDRAVKLTIKNVGKKKVGVLDVPGFYVGLTNDVKTQLQKMAKSHITALVIDLRCNGGGALTEAVSLSGLFIPRGPIVQVIDKKRKIRQDVDDIVYYKGSLTVLIDRFSASASEIFAAAMQDYGRALIIGEPSFGKGTVQQYHLLSRVYDHMLCPDCPALGSVQYTTKKFYRINGGSTQRKGVIPDIVMPTGIDPAETGENFEDNALPWDSIAPASYSVVGNISQYVPNLITNYMERIAKDPEFKYIEEDIARYRAMKASKNIISLNYVKREKENKKADTIKLRRINERFARQGKAPLKTIDDLPKNYELPDPYLNEAVRIAVDLANLEALHLAKK
ncbi:MAG: carboxy terminal-processing peptidase [Arsenophonus endosymbiont of Dermacentor nuttalli]